MKIDKNIPLPEKKEKSKYPWNKMTLGDSLMFKLPGTSVSPQVTRASRRTGFKFEMHKVKNGTRVWRVK